MAKDFDARFKVEPGKKSRLGERDPGDIKLFPNREAAETQSIKDGEEIDRLQDVL
jgi:hypothetical protein